ncbi:MAG: polysaccharide biosynthesis/export family protein, partial [Saprospiraceae bacterium]
MAQTKSALIEKAYSEIEKKGITESELSDALDKRGISLDELKTMDTAEALRYQSEVEGVIKELEQKKLNEKPKKSKVPSAIDARSINKGNRMVADSLLEKNRLDTIAENKKIKDSFRSAFLDSFKEVEIWGQHIFKNKSIQLYESSTNAKAPANYILGVGDQISVSIWGISQYNEQFEINSEGYIAPARMPRIFLKGISLGRAKTMMSNYFRRFYRFDSNQFDVNLISSRTVQINIVGEVEHFGSFTLPSINSVFNALVNAGGPNKIGSVRKIK